jgi:hypothetical protein
LVNHIYIAEECGKHFTKIEYSRQRFLGLILTEIVDDDVSREVIQPTLESSLILSVSTLD